MKLPFIKYQGIGNDFVVVDGRVDPLIADYVEQPLVAKALCERHLGVGADGVLSIRSSQVADAAMVVTNADGSVAEMCGNGLRCVVRYLWDHDQTLHRESMTVETGAGVLACQVQFDEGHFVSASVSMGVPCFEQSDIPARFFDDPAKRIVDARLKVKGRMTAVTALSLGNPHAVIFCHHRGDALKAIAAELGPLIEVHEFFPKRCNVEFVHQVDEIHLETWVWERGCGLTQACGTGATAVAIAACVLGKSKPGTELQVLLPGGPLHIQVSPVDFSATMRGPAEPVFQGVYAPQSH